MFCWGNMLSHVLCQKICNLDGIPCLFLVIILVSFLLVTLLMVIFLLLSHLLLWVPMKINVQLSFKVAYQVLSLTLGTVQVQIVITADMVLPCDPVVLDFTLSVRLSLSSIVYIWEVTGIKTRYKLKFFWMKWIIFTVTFKFWSWF